MPNMALTRWIKVGGGSPRCASRMSCSRSCTASQHTPRTQRAGPHAHARREAAVLGSRGAGRGAAGDKNFLVLGVS